MNTNLAKLIAVGLVAGVAKALFGPPPAPRSTHAENLQAHKDLALVKDND